MSEQVSDDFLDQTLDFANELMDGVVRDVTERTIRGAMVSVVVAELRARRAADLSAEDKEVLAWLRECISTGNALPPNGMSRVLAASIASDILSRLLTGATP